MPSPFVICHSSLTIVTGASSNHFLPLQSLLWTIAKFEPAARVIAYNLGLTPDEHAYLEHTPPFYLKHFELRTFDFNQYPPHFSMAQEAGRMAFRPTVLAAIAHEQETRNQKHETLLLWLDAGCQLREPLHEIRACIHRDGVYCPCAPGTIENTLHAAARAPLSVREDLLPVPIRDAGICGFNISNPQIVAFLDRWAEVALDKSCTAPRGSTRHTHRQDAVFAVLLNQGGKTNCWKLETNRLRGLAIKQDTLTLTETKFRIGTH